jgi:hypothetical protein
MFRRLGVVAILLLAGSFALADVSYPKPSPYPISWELEFTHSLPKRIVVDTANAPAPQAFWYVTYRVTNNTDHEQTFLPQFELLADNAKLYRSDQNIPKVVFDSIKDREHNHFLEPMETITGEIRIGPAEARDAVAIWPEPMTKMGHFSIFAAGLSGETVMLRMVNGDFQKVQGADDLKDKTGLIILRKSLQMNFFIRGGDVYPGEEPVNAQGEEWIMR